MTASAIRPRAVHYYSEALRVRVRHTVAFQATCRCGWKGSWRSSRVTASDDYADHKLTDHGTTD